MAIGQNDIQFYKSLFTNGTTISLGGDIDTSAPLAKNQDPAAPLFNQVFRDFTNAERTSGTLQSHAIFLKNNHATLTATNVRLWFAAVTPAPDTVARLGLSGTGKNAACVTIANIHGIPSGVDLDTRHNDLSEAIVIPDLAPSDYIGFWIRVELRPNAAIYNKDWLQVRVNLDSPA